MDAAVVVDDRTGHLGWSHRGDGAGVVGGSQVVACTPVQGTVVCRGPGLRTERGTAELSQGAGGGGRRYRGADAPPAGDVAPRTPAGSRIRAARKAVRQVAVLVLVVASVSARASPCRAWPSTYRPSAAHLMLRQHRRQKSVTTVAAPASPSRENAFAIRTPLHETARQPHAHVPREVPRDAATKTGRPTPPLPGEPEKLAGQMPFAAGSRIATHSTCEVIGNMSHVAGREETSGQRALYGS